VNILNTFLLIVGVGCAAVAAVGALRALEQAKEAAFYQYQAETLADLNARSIRVLKVAELLESTFNYHVSSAAEPLAALQELETAIIGFEDCMPTSAEIARSPAKITEDGEGRASLRPDPTFHQICEARQEVRAEMLKIETARALNASSASSSPPRSWWGRRWTQSDRQYEVDAESQDEEPGHLVASTVIGREVSGDSIDLAVREGFGPAGRPRHRSGWARRWTEGTWRAAIGVDQDSPEDPEKPLVRILPSEASASRRGEPEDAEVRWGDVGASQHDGPVEPRPRGGSTTSTPV
jgi:hypothetical protein